MSVKNLARALLQGGKSEESKRNRRAENRRSRSAARRFARDASAGGGLDANLPDPRPVRAASAVRAGPALQWGRRMAGRSFDEAHSILASRHDRRTPAGRLVRSQFLDKVASATDASWPERRYVVDEDGRLCTRDEFESPPERPFAYTEDLIAWCRGRYVTHVEGVPHWLVPTRQETHVTRHGRRTRVAVACAVDEPLSEQERLLLDGLPYRARQRLRFGPAVVRQARKKHRQNLARIRRARQ